MNKLQKDHLVWQLAKRLELVGQCQAKIEGVGSACRQIAALDQKLTIWLAENELPVPDTFLGQGFRPMVDQELNHQIQVGDPPRDSFLATVTAPRENLEQQTKERHSQLLAGQPQKGETP